METRFEVTFLGEALAFYYNLDDQVKAKVIYNIQRAKRIVDPELFKKLNKHIWEFRTNYARNQIRFFWDPFEKSLVICTRGTYKRSQKTLKRDLQKAEEIRTQYLKRNQDEKK